MPKHPLWFLGFQSQPAYRGATHDVVDQGGSGVPSIDDIRASLTDLLPDDRQGRLIECTGEGQSYTDALLSVYEDLSYRAAPSDASPPVSPHVRNGAELSPEIVEDAEVSPELVEDAEVSPEIVEDAELSPKIATSQVPTTVNREGDDLFKTFNLVMEPHAPSYRASYNGGIGPLGNVLAQM